jgi:Bacterial Ig-like domain (group 3)
MVAESTNAAEAISSSLTLLSRPYAPQSVIFVEGERSVTFLDGATTLGTGTVSGGNVTFMTAALTPGGHSLTASYGGDGNFSGSTFTALNQIVMLSCQDVFLLTVS